MKIKSNLRKKFAKDILTYLGDDVTKIELTLDQINLAIDLGYMDYLKNTTSNLFELCLGHSMIMLALARSKFSSLSVPGAELDMSLNVNELMTTGRKLLDQNK